METFTLSKKKLVFHKLRVEKRAGTPYRTQSYLPGGARPKKWGCEEAGLSPRFPEEKILEE